MNVLEADQASQSFELFSQGFSVFAAEELDPGLPGLDILTLEATAAL